jgi:hypothetical protein
MPLFKGSKLDVSKAKILSAIKVMKGKASKKEEEEVLQFFFLRYMLEW